MNREKFAYDLSLLCVSHALEDLNPTDMDETVDFALKCFKNSYNKILRSSDPVLEIIDTISLND